MNYFQNHHQKLNPPHFQPTLSPFLVFILIPLIPNPYSLHSQPLSQLPFFLALGPLFLALKTTSFILIHYSFILNLHLDVLYSQFVLSPFPTFISNPLFLLLLSLSNSLIPPTSNSHFDPFRTCNFNKYYKHNLIHTLKIAPRTITHSSKVLKDILVLLQGEIFIINKIRWRIVIQKSIKKPNLMLVFSNSSLNVFFIKRATTRPQLYHSMAIVLHDTKIVIGGSNPNIQYKFKNVKYKSKLWI